MCGFVQAEMSLLIVIYNIQRVENPSVARSDRWSVDGTDNAMAGLSKSTTVVRHEKKDRDYQIYEERKK